MLIFGHRWCRILLILLKWLARGNSFGIDCFNGWYPYWLSNLEPMNMQLHQTRITGWWRSIISESQINPLPHNQCFMKFCPYVNGVALSLASETSIRFICLISPNLFFRVTGEHIVCKEVWNIACCYVCYLTLKWVILCPRSLLSIINSVRFYFTGEFLPAPHDSRSW